MKFYTHRVAAAALAVALSLPPVAAAAPARRDRSREEVTPIVHIVQKIQKLLGIRTNEDLPQPPLPAPPPPPTNP